MVRNPKYRPSALIIFVFAVLAFLLTQTIIGCSPLDQPTSGTDTESKEQQPATPFQEVPSQSANRVTATVTPIHSEVFTPVSSPTHTLTPTSPSPSTQTPPTATVTVPPPPTPTPTPIPDTGISSKRGFLLPGAYSEYCEEDFNTLDAGWYYQNGTTPPAECPSPDPRFVPRIFNAEAATDENIGKAISNALASGWLLGFGEPNISWNGNTTPEDGARAWRKIEEAASPAGIKLVAPGPSQHDPCYFSCDKNLYGYTWIWEMVDAYQALYGERPHFDAMAWSFYTGDPLKFQAFLIARRQEALARGYDVPVWVLEYAGECWNTDKYPTGNYEIMTQITPVLASTPWIARYAWFTNRIRADDSWAENHHSCSLIDPDTGNLTELGKLYATY